ncbi:hypothetical protein EXIGLDRAFT_603826, partial [Exidia glandulosa HHB12029]
MLPSQSATRLASRDGGHSGYRAAPPARANVADAVAGTEGEASEGAELGQQVFAFLSDKNKSRGPPKNGYPFPLDPFLSDPQPPSECRACGGMHWHKDCKHHDAYQLSRKTKPAMVADVEPSPEDDFLYRMAYFLNTLPSSSYDSASGADFERARALLNASNSREGTRSVQSTVEEVPDEEWKEFAARDKLPPDSRYILEERSGVVGAVPGLAKPRRRSSVEEVQDEEPAGDDDVMDVAPPRPGKEYFVHPVRRTPPGLSSLGITILSVRGVVGDKSSTEIVLRLDSGASISLIAEDYLLSLKNPPKIRTGMKVTLAQLTNNEPRIRGYVEMPIWVRAEDGTQLRFNAELYVVPGMTVEVLLGEDFHLNHELNVLRNVELGTRRYARSLVVHDPQVQSFVKRMQHRRSKANERRRKKAHFNGAITAWKDVLIPAETSVNVPIAGNLQEGSQWYVERYMVPQADETFLTVPNTLLDWSSESAGRAEEFSIARKGTVPVANPTKTPRLVRAGTLLGYAKSANLYLDKPRTPERLHQMEQAAAAYSTL